MSTVAPYPHVEIGVRDESIYIPIDIEDMPLSQPLYFMRAQKGPIGVPVWCPTYSVACRVFGTDTFNKRSKYFSEQSKFLLQTFPMNGAWLMRVAANDVASADIQIEVGISKATVDVPQWDRDANGCFQLELNGSKIPLNDKGIPCARIESPDRKMIYMRALESIARAREGGYFTRESNYNYGKVEPSDRRLKGTDYFAGNGVPTLSAVTESTPDPDVTYFELDVDGDNYTATPVFGLTEFDGSKEYLKLTAWSGGYTAVTTVDDGSGTQEGPVLPQIPTGNTQGDRFVKISKAPLKLIENDGSYTVDSGDADTQKAYKSYFYTRALDADEPYTYTPQSIPVGTYIAEETLYYQYGYLDDGDLEPQATIQGRKLVWRAKVADRSADTGRAVGKFKTYDSDNFTWYPVVDIVAENPGVWGESFGIRLYFDKDRNTIALQQQNGAVNYTIAPIELLEGDTLPTPVVGTSQDTYVVGTMRAGVVDPETDVDLSLIKRVPNLYKGQQRLPIKITPIPEAWNQIGKILMEAEMAARESIMSLYNNPERIAAGYPAFRTVVDTEGNEVVETFVDALYGKVASTDDIGDEDGHMANALSCMDAEEIPYFATACVDLDDSDVRADARILSSDFVFIPAQSVPIYLGGGDDGDISDFAIEKYIRGQIKAGQGGTQEYLLDYPRCPFNMVYDTGVSLKTKKAYIDMMSFRDNVVVNVATQTTWLTATGEIPAINGEFPNNRSDDESIGASLRSYAWLMREDVNNGTEACRCKIFLHAGRIDGFDGWVPATLWIAMKDAQYLNLDHIDQEPAGLPNSAVECFTEVSWRAGTADTQSRCWNAGLNYWQSYDKDTADGAARLHYAALRTVYRYETSVLVDSGVVNALVFSKDIVRKSWAKFAGVKMWSAELNARITKDLTQRLSYMLNGRYTAEVNVYQNDEDVKLGYTRHVDIILTSPATNRVWQTTIICRREGYDPNAAE